MKVINSIIKFFKTVQKRFVGLGKGITGFGGALLSGILAVFQSFKIGGESVFKNTGKMMEVVWGYIECAGEFVFKLPQCFVVHVITGIFTLAYYLFFRLPVMLIELVIGFSLKPQVDMVWSIITTGDEILYSLSGIYLTRLPPSIEKKCYSCRGRKYTSKQIDEGQEKMEKAGKRINTDFNVKIAKLYRKPRDKMNNSIKQLKKTFS